MLIQKATVLAAVLSIFVTTQFANAISGNDNVLEIGSKAPALDIENWVNGVQTPVTKFESGKVYVVEFWATWCGPCIATMPHLSELQKKYKSKGVRVISISDEDVETVEEFLAGNVRGESETTYKELTSVYSLTSDPDLSSHNDYMKASGENGIPAAYIVGKDGHIEWMGHPAEMDEALEAVTSDKWDRVSYGKQLAADKEAMQAIQTGMQSVMQKMQAGESDEAIELVGELIEEHSKTSYAKQLSAMQLELMLSVDHDEAASTLMQFAKDNPEPELLNRLAWTIVEMKNSGVELNDEVVSAATTVAEKAVESNPKNGQLLDSLAHLYHFAGKLDKAIETQTKAVENAGDLKAEIEPYLQELLDEKAKK